MDTSPPSSGSQARSWARWVLAALLVLAVVVFYALDLQQYLSWDYVRGHLGLWRDWLADHAVAVLVCYFLVYTAVTALSLPAAAIRAAISSRDHPVRVATLSASVLKRCGNDAR